VLLGLTDRGQKPRGTDAEGFAIAIDVGYETSSATISDQDQSNAHRDGGALVRRRRAGGCLVTYVVVLGCGPSAAADTDQPELVRRLDTSDEWIVQRTGIRQRQSQPMASSLASGDQRRAGSTRACGIDAQSIDLIVLATSTRTTPFPPPRSRCRTGSASIMARAFDLQACAPVRVRARHRRQFPARRQLPARVVIGAETFFRESSTGGGSRHLRAVRRRAGAIVLEAQEAPARPPTAVLTTICVRRTAQVETLCRWRTVLDQGRRFLRMEGREVFKHASMITDVIRRCLQRHRPQRRRYRLVSCRIRPTSESSTRQRTSFICAQKSY